MKTLFSLASVLMLFGLLQGCSSNTASPNNVSSSPTSVASSKAPGVTSKITPIDPKTNPQFFTKSGIKPENVENKAVLTDDHTLALSLAGGSSCPSVPETITVLDDQLNILLQENSNECTTDLTASFWEIRLPEILIPRTTDLTVDVVHPRGIKLILIAPAPK